MRRKLLVILSQALVIFLLIFLVEFYKSKIAERTIKSNKIQKDETSKKINEALTISDELENVNKSLKNQLAAMRAENSGLKIDNSFYQERLKQKESELAEKIKQSEDLKGNLALLELQMKSKKGENTSSKALPVDEAAKNKEYKKIIEEIFSQNKNLSNRLAKAEEEAKKLTSKIQTLEESKYKYSSTQQDKEKMLKNYSMEIVNLQNENVNLNVKSQEFVKENKTLKDALAAFETEKKRMLGLIASLEKEKASFLEDKEKVKQSLARVNDGIQNKDDRIKSLEEEIVDLSNKQREANSQYELAKKKADGIEGDLAKRAERVLRLQESLDEKNNTISESTAKLENQLKDLANLRENMVEIKLENSRLAQELKYKEELLNVLQGEMQKISEVNSQFRENIDRAFRTTGIEKLKPKLEGQPDDLIKTKEDKEVEVELDSAPLPR